MFSTTGISLDFNLTLICFFITCMVMCNENIILAVCTLRLIHDSVNLHTNYDLLLKYMYLCICGVVFNMVRHVVIYRHFQYATERFHSTSDDFDEEHIFWLQAFVKWLLCNTHPFTLLPFFSMFFIYRLLQDNFGYHLQSFHSRLLQFYAIIWMRF